MTREQVIDKLIDDDIQLIKTQDEINQHEYIFNILNDGFCGYRKFTNKELVDEYNERFDDILKVKNSVVFE